MMEEKMEVIVDRFEGDYAVVEIAIGKCVNIPRVLVPDAKEGDIIKIEIEKKETEKRKKYIKDLMNNVFE
jgi:ribosome recycling factor